LEWDKSLVVWELDKAFQSLELDKSQVGLEWGKFPESLKRTNHAHKLPQVAALHFRIFFINKL